VEGAGLAFGTGDPDGLCFPVAGRATPAPWRKGGALAMLSMQAEDGTPFFADPRGVLAGIVGRFAALGLTPVVATELEFYLHETNVQGAPVPPAYTPGDRYGLASAQVLSTDALARHETLFGEIIAAAQALGIPADTLLRENGPAQFEINLLHRADALAAAEDAILLKRVAAVHGLGATFMAKPYGQCSGSGMHIHISLLDDAGKPVFADAQGAPTPALFHGVAGLLAGMADSTLVLAPHANSYRRFRHNSHAPTTVGWGMDDRSAAVRVVVGGPYATRIEHRVAGADANPFLAVASVLAGVLEGLERGKMPPDPQDRTAPAQGQQLPRDWGAAIDLFAASDRMGAWFGPAFRDLFAACKRQDHDELLSRVSDVEYHSYLSIV
jgi:glutamine synthetase